MNRPTGVTGALVVDKPAGPTSHDIVARVRKTLRTRVGHTGTLDPLATGVLVLLLGKATRLMPLFEADTKTYWARLALGSATDTFDREGRVTQEGPVPELSDGDCESVLARFQGEIEQQPPLYSAVRVAGERLYRAARRGDQPERPKRMVTVFSIELLERSASSWIVRIDCSSGTYVRTIADDIGKALGCGAHLHELRRERSGDFRLDQAADPALPAEALQLAIIPPEQLLPQLPRIDLPELEARRVRHGNAVALGFTPPAASAYRLFDEGELIAIGRRVLSRIQPFIVFHDGNS